MRLPRSHWMLMAFVIAALGILSAGIWAYRAQEERLRRDAEAELEAIGWLKVGQIAQWRAERLGDAALVMHSPQLVEGVARWLAEARPEDAEAILTPFRALHAYYGYDDILLVDASGQIRLSLQDEHMIPHPEVREALQRAWIEHAPVLADLHLDEHGERPHMGVVAPLYTAEGAPMAAVILQADADAFLYPLIQTWPMPSQSGETLLVRQDGDEVLFLNELRHTPDAALHLRIPLSETHVPAVMAVLGWQGVFEGLDYRGVPVVAVIREVPDSPWFLVSKMDRAEIYAEWRTYAGVWAALIVALLTTLATGTAALWQGRERLHYQALAEAQANLHASEARYRTTLLSIGDGVIVTDAQGRVEIMNAVAEGLTGWSQKQATGQPLDAIFDIVNEETRLPVENPVHRVLREGAIVGLANHTLLLGRDGVERPIADSGAPVRNDTGQVSGVVLVFRDQTEERAAQRALAESEARFRALFDASPLAVALYDLQGHLLECNQTMVHLLGYTAEELATKDPTHPDDRAAGAELFRRVVTGELAGYRRQKRYVRKDGTILWAQLTAAPILGAEGRAAYVTLVFEDITERRQAEEALRESEARFRALFENSISGVAIHRIVLDEQGQPVDYVFEDANPAFEQQTGLRLADILGCRATEVLPGIEDTPLIEIYGGVVLTGRPIRFEQYFDPLERHYAISAFALDGERFAAVFDDITERKRAEETLAQERALLRTVIDNLPDAVYVKDTQARKVLANAVDVRTLGAADEAEVLGKTDEEILGPELAAPFMADDMAVIETGQPVLARDERLVLADGTERFGLTSKVPLRDADGRIIGLVGISRDITEQRRAEEERQRLEQRLQEVQKIEAVGRLAGGVAHDFNNMFQTILGYAEIALEDVPAESLLAEYLREIRAAGQRSASLTRHLLAFARRQTIQPKALDLNDHVAGTLKMLGRLIDEDIALVWKPGANLGLVMMDPVQVDQILTNLVVNARDAIEGPGEIVIETDNASVDEACAREHVEAIAGHYVALTVTDTGRGIDPDTWAHLFEPFYTTKPVGEGTGLGLATVYGIAKQNEGFVTVYSEPGHGATFRVYLPRLDAELEPEVAEGASEALPRGSETVLLVEDEPSLLRLATHLLTQLGYTVLAARLPEEAQALDREHGGEIHLVITDVVMPGMNGRELTEQIRQRRPDVRCLFMSGYTANVIAHRGVVDDGVAFLQKPFSLETLAHSVRAALDARSRG